MGRKADVLGKKYNRWTVIKYEGDKRGVMSNGKSYLVKRVLCKCDCGTERVMDVGTVTQGKSKSCGCFKSERCGNLKRLQPGEAMLNRIISSYKNSAKSRGLSFSLSRDEIEHVVNQDCVYCGTPPSNIKKPRDVDMAYMYNGIDRIDNSKGYDLGNVVTCCKRCNYAKRDSTLDQFKMWIKSAYTKLWCSTHPPVTNIIGDC